jgi:hypothetical protein
MRRDAEEDSKLMRRRGLEVMESARRIIGLKSSGL